MEANTFIKGIGAGLLALSMTVGAASAATVFSDDFESPVNSQSWQVYQNFDSWATTSGTGIEIQANSAGVIKANSGTQYVELDSDSSRGGASGKPTNSSMTTKLDLDAGSYRVDWYYQPRTDDANDNTISVYLAGVGEDLFSTLLGTINKTTLTSTGWKMVSYFFTVDGMKNQYALTFRAEGTSNSLGGFIDDVSVAAVPVPAAGFLLIGALGGLAALRRRKTAA